jgi:hypothetical protein
MSHKHITFADARRFARLAMGIVPDDDPEWIAQYVANVRSCDSCGEAALRANRLLLPTSTKNASTQTTGARLSRHR